MAYYRRKLPPKQDAKMGICVAIFSIIVCIGMFAFGTICAIGIIMGDKGSLILRIIGGIGFFAFFGGGGGIGGIVACVDSLKDEVEKLKKLKDCNEDKSI